MSARGALQCGRAVTSATTGSAVTLVPRDCTVLGFWANATTTISVNDAASAAASAAGNQQVNITVCAVGWNPLPIDLTAGLTVTQGAQVWFVIA